MTYMTEDSSGKSSNYTARECDTKIRRRAQTLAFLFRHRAVHQLVTKLVHRELSNCIWYLSAKQFISVSVICQEGAAKAAASRQSGSQTQQKFQSSSKDAHLHRMGRNPAYSPLNPSSLLILAKPETSPVAYPRSDTSRIRVASNGVRRMSAKNLEWRYELYASRAQH